MPSSVESHFDQISADYDQWKRKAGYYYEFLKGILVNLIPSHAEVCEIGTATGDLLASLFPVRGLGIDISREMIRFASTKHPNLRFEVHDITSSPVSETFPYIFAVDVAEHLIDLRAAVKNMASMMSAPGKLVITTANPAWAPILKTAEKLGLKMPEGDHQWRTIREITDIAFELKLDVTSARRDFIIPRAIPGLKLLNEAEFVARIRDRFGLIQILVFEKNKH